MLIGRAHKETQRARASLGSMPEIATRMIDVLNYRTSSQLIKMGIGNRTETISLIRRVMTLRNLIQTLERRTQDMQADINKFQNRFMALQNRGLPSPLDPSGKLLSHEKYAKRVSNFAATQISEASSASTEAGPVTGQILFDRVDNLFFIRNEIAHLFDEPPHFYKYTEADETMGSILKHQLPSSEVWEELIRLLLNQSQ